MPMIPAGIIKQMPHNWQDGGSWVKFNYTTAFLKLYISAPWVRVSDSSGKPLTTGQWELTKEYQSKKNQLVAAKATMEQYLNDLLEQQTEIHAKMVEWRSARRLWESEVAIAQGAQEPDRIREWAAQANLSDEDGGTDTYNHSKTFSPDNSPVYLPPWVGEIPLPLYMPAKIKAIQEAISQISKEIDNQNRASTPVKRPMKLRYADDDDRYISPTIPRPTDRELLMTWILERYNAWSSKAPTRRDDPFQFYNLPENADGFFEKDHWPDRVRGIVGQLRIPHNTNEFPWGIPASALNHALSDCPGYSNNTIYEEEANTLLGNLEDFWFAQKNHDALDWKRLYSWPISADMKKQLRTLMTKLGAT
ncbi:hypothetical protein CFD26_108370 [Aspergillus turcosus]|uniref:Uncharacterized protein n=1 Tax=Aspergillus turcosus TaxID=1245748 RepID=A0A421DD77_9EURO|nr:hypothetical protein CFD26_108370 [Aspergillus turcosus]